MERHGEPVAGFWVVKGPPEGQWRPNGGQSFTKAGTIYRRTGDQVPDAPALTDHQREQERKEKEKAQNAAIGRAFELFKAGVPNHPFAVAYAASRGIQVDALPGGVLPKVLRTIPDRVDWLKEATGDEGWHESRGPVIYCGAYNAHQPPKFVGCQRLFLDAEGKGKRRPAEGGPKLETKLATQGASLGGAAVRLCAGYGTQGWLVLCEGVETGLALLQALGQRAGVWACISTAGLEAVELPAGDSGAGGEITRIVIAGDHDRVSEKLQRRPGEFAAERAAKRLREKYPHIPCAVALPDYASAPLLVGEDGEIIGGGKSVDWLDVLVRHGSLAVAAAIEHAEDEGEKPLEDHEEDLQQAEDGGLDFVRGLCKDEGVPLERVLSSNTLRRARRMLRERFAPDERSPMRGWRLRRSGETWYRWQGNRYEAILGLEAEELRVLVEQWVNLGWWQVKGGKRPRIVRLNPSPKQVNEIILSLKTDTYANAAKMPCWLAPDFNQEGRAIGLDRDPFNRIMTPEAVAAEGLPQAEDLLIFRDRALDLRAWACFRKAHTYELSERLFSMTALPYDCPPELADAADADDADLDEAIARLAPVWLEFLEKVNFDKDPQWPILLAQCMGGTLARWTRRFEKFPVLCGAKGGGKGTVLARWMQLVGERNYASCRSALLTKQFVMINYVDKLLVNFPDLEMGRSADGLETNEILKMWTGGDPFFMDRKYKEPIAAAVIPALPVVSANQMLSIPDPGGALAARMLVLPFVESFREDAKVNRKYKDPEIIAREAPGVMLWALRGLRWLVQQGRYAETVRGLQWLRVYEDYSDPGAKFAEEELELNPESWTSVADLYGRWCDWCKKAGRDPGNDGAFIKRLLATCRTLDREERDVKTGDLETEKRWGYRGVRLVQR
jgi:hypothetical protein